MTKRPRSALPATPGGDHLAEVAAQYYGGDRIKAAIDMGGGQTVDVEGVLRSLRDAGYVIVPG